MAHGARLYVGNLSFNTTEESVRELFAQDGRTVVEVKLVTDRDSGQPRGFGFVEMANAQEAQAAIAACDGQALDGRTLKVSEAQERSNGAANGRGGGGRGRGGGQRW